MALWVACWPTPSQAQPSLQPAAPAWQFSASSDRHCDAVPLADLDRDAHALDRLSARPGRNLCYVEDELRLSHQQADWRLSLLARQSAHLTAQRDTLDLVRRAQQGDAPTQDTHWTTRARFQQFVGGGLELRRTLRLAPQWQAELALQGLSLHRWRERRWDGQAGYNAASGSYQFQMHSFQGDSELDFPFQQAYARTGQAWLLKLGVQAQAGAWEGGLQLRDWGQLRWDGQPQQQMVLNSDTRSVDANGFVVYAPLVEGRNSQAGRSQRLGGRWQGQLGWSDQPGRLWQARVDHQAELGWLPALAWRQRSVADLDLSAQWQLHQRRLTLGVAGPQWQLHLGADRLGGAVKSQAWGASWGQPW